MTALPRKGCLVPSKTLLRARHVGHPLTLYSESKKGRVGQLPSAVLPPAQDLLTRESVAHGTAGTPWSLENIEVTPWSPDGQRLLAWLAITWGHASKKVALLFYSFSITFLAP